MFIPKIKRSSTFGPINIKYLTFGSGALLYVVSRFFPRSPWDNPLCCFPIHGDFEQRFEYRDCYRP